MENKKSEKVCVSVKLTKEEYKEFVNKSFIDSNKGLFITLFVMFIISSVICVLIDNLIGIFIIFGLFALICLYHYYTSCVLVVKRFDKSDLSKLTAEYEFGKTKILVKTAKGESKIQYNELYKVICTKNCFVFFINKKSGFIIPKRSINDDIDIIKKYLNDKIKKENLKI